MEPLVLLAAVMVPGAFIALAVLMKMAADLSVIRKIAQAYEVRADEQWRREHNDLMTRIHARAGLPRRSEMYRPAEKDPGGAA